MYNKIFLADNYSMNNKVGEYRYKQNMTLKELSQRSGISATTLSKIENDQTNDILFSNAIILSHILKVDLYELFCINR